MIAVQPTFFIEGFIPLPEDILRHLERAARICYQSTHKIGDYANTRKFIGNILKAGHHSIIEHFSVTVRIVCDRGVTHELVRHRLAVYSQESTRFCNYSGNGIQIIHPPGLSPAQIERREKHFWAVQALYDAEIAEGLSPQIARGVLPTATKTEIVMTANLREWRHVFNLRALGAAGKPHPQMLEIMVPMLRVFQEKIPVVFDDMIIEE